MNFKNIFLAVAAIALVLTSCNKSKDLTDVIPADSNYVLHLDNKSLIEKSQYDIFSNPTVLQGINMYKVMLKDEDKVKLLDEFLKNPNSLGLDLKQDVYVYSNLKVYGVVVGVNNATKLKEVLTKLASVSEEDIVKTGDIYSISPDSKMAIAWDGSRLVAIVDILSVYSRNENSASVSQLAIDQLNQSADKSINSNKSFSEFAKAKKDVSVFYSLNGMENLSALAGMSDAHMEEAFAPFKKLMGEMKGVSMGMYTSYEKGEIKLTGQYYFDTPETEKKFKEYSESVAGVLKGDHLKYVTPDPLFMTSMNLKGEGIYNQMKNFGIMNKIVEELPDSIRPEQIEELIKCFSGDVTFAVTTIKKSVQKTTVVDKIEVVDEVDELFFEEEMATTIPECLFFADVTDAEKVLSFIKKQMDDNGRSYKELSPTSYQITENGMNIYFGVNNNMFYATNIESVYGNLNSTDLKNNYADLVKDKMFIVSGDFNSVIPYLEEQGSALTMTSLIAFLNEFGKYEMTMSAKDFKTEGKLDFQNKEKNSLAVLCQQLDQLITNLASSMMF